MQAEGQGALVVGQAGALTLRLARNADGGPVGPVRVVHERPFHVFVASNDLRSFHHLHPDLPASQASHDRLPLRWTPDQAGWHRAWVEFQPEGGGPELLSTPFDVPGPLPPSPSPLVPDDLSQAKLVDGVQVFLAKEAESLTFTLRQDGRIPELTPYLGADGHAIAIREGSLDLVHIHPQGPARAGQVSFQASFPSAGTYKLWGEFQPAGRLIQAAFVVRVSAAEAALPLPSHDHASH